MQYNKSTSKIKAAAAAIAALAAQYDSPTDRALLAAALIELGWLPARAQEATGANADYLGKARHLDPEQYQLVECKAAKLYTFRGNGHAGTGNGGAI